MEATVFNGRAIIEYSMEAINHLETMGWILYENTPTYGKFIILTAWISEKSYMLTNNDIINDGDINCIGNLKLFKSLINYNTETDSRQLFVNETLDLSDSIAWLYVYYDTSLINFMLDEDYDMTDYSNYRRATLEEIIKYIK